MPVEFARFNTDIGARHTRWVVLCVHAADKEWLAFIDTTSLERRRLSPVPPEWTTLDETALIHLLDQADRIDPPAGVAGADQTVDELHAFVRTLESLASRTKAVR
jgi:hypothetical protein